MEPWEEEETTPFWEKGLFHPVLLPSLYISTRGLNKLSEDELRELARLGMSTFGMAPLGARSALYTVYEPENLDRIKKILDEKGIRYKEIWGLRPRPQKVY